MRNPLYLLTWLAIALAAPAKAQNHVSPDEIIVETTKTYIKTYKSDALTNRPVLMVALHGDLPNPTYQYTFARIVAGNSDNTISVGMLRPGYTDDVERTSDGVMGETVGDNYDAPRLQQIAAAIRQLGAHYNASKVILAGHSGGGAITAKLIAAYPGLIDHAVVVSCPCDVNSWRADMYETSQYEGFNGPIDVVSPIDVAASIPNSTSVTIISGRQDRVAKTYLSQRYYDRLMAAGKQAEITFIEGEHSIFLRREIISSIIAKIAAYSESLP